MFLDIDSVCCQNWFAVLLKLHPAVESTAQPPVVESTAQPSLPSCVSDRKELPADLSKLPLESQVEELSIRYVLPFSMLGLLFPSSGRGVAGAQSALSQCFHKITTPPGFQCLFPRTEVTVLNLFSSSPAHREVFFFCFLAGLGSSWMRTKAEGCSGGDCEKERGRF